MKRCPECRKDYLDDSILFCLDDGAPLVQGRIKKLRLVLSSREALAEFTTTAMAQRKFWRRPTLARLT